MKATGPSAHDDAHAERAAQHQRGCVHTTASTGCRMTAPDFVSGHKSKLIIRNMAARHEVEDERVPGLKQSPGILRGHVTGASCMNRQSKNTRNSR